VSNSIHEWRWITVGVLFAVLISPATALADGKLSPAVFTVKQAESGAAIYSVQCASCHGTELQGSPFAPPLSGSMFEGRWGGAPLSELFAYLRASMPPAAPGSLGDERMLAVLAHLLRTNGATAGDSPLPADEARLATMAVPGTAQSGQARLRANSYMRLTPGVAMPPWPEPRNRAATLESVNEDMLSHPPAGSWLTWRRSHNAHGFSPLTAINAKTVSRLQLEWSLILPPGPNTIEPLVHDGVLFVFAYGDSVFALDASTGDELWRYERRLPEDQRRDSKRTLALWSDKLFVGTSDVHVVALDIHTGRVVWDRAAGGPEHRISGGPLAANGVVMQGTTSSHVPGGGHIAAFDADTGKELWRFKTVAQPGQPGGNTWNGLPAEARSGGSVWVSGTYDADLDLAFFGPGPTYDTGPMRFPSAVPGVTNDALYTDTTLALRPRTGELVWFYQHMRNDQWDMDWAFERVVFERSIDGVPTKLLVTSGKHGWFDVLNAATGRYVGSFEMGIQNLILGADPKSGEKLIDPSLLPGGLDHAITVCPFAGGGRNWMPTAFDDKRNLLFVVAVESCMEMAPLPEGEHGFLSTDVTLTISPPEDSDGRFGRLQALDAGTGKTVWTARQRAPHMTGVLATAGGVLFAGSLDRYFTAYEESSGAELWRTRLPDVPNGSPVTYEVDGRQYVAVVVGMGSPTTDTWLEIIPEVTLPSVRSSAIFVFALPEQVPGDDRDAP